MAVKQNQQVLIPALDMGTASNPAALAAWWDKVKFAFDQVLPQLISNVNDMVSGNFETLTFRSLPKAPVNLKTGQVAYADGTNWNPGAGEGLYEYRSDAAWHKL